MPGLFLLGVDFETHWSSEYSLTKIPQALYINDKDRFRAHGAAIKVGANKALWVTHGNLPKVFSSVPWERTIVYAHNATFDGGILEWVYGCRPARYVCTMGLSRAVLGSLPGRHSLDSVGQYLGLKGKAFYDSFANTRGHHYLPPEVERALIPYALNDIELSYKIMVHLLKGFPPKQLDILDWSVKAAVRPVLRLNGPMLWDAHHAEVERKQKLLEALDLPGLDDMVNAVMTGRGKTVPKTRVDAIKRIVVSDDKLAALLEPLLDAYGDEIPMKASRTAKEPDGTPKMTYAFASSDEHFVDLADHEDDAVSVLASTRLAVKGSIVETRTKKMAMVADAMPGSRWPVGVNYCGAVQTKRLAGNTVGGGNPLNLKRGSIMRDAVEAPDGYVVVSSDLSQIELRLSAYMVGHNDILEMLANGDDLYSYFAGHVYEREISKKHDPEERQVGKVAVLSLGYSAAWEAFKRMLLVQAKMRVDRDFAERVVTTYRTIYSLYPAAWRDCRSTLAAWVKGVMPAEHKLLRMPPAFKWGVGSVTGPSGLSLSYPGMRQVRRLNPFTKEQQYVYVFKGADPKKSWTPEGETERCQSIYGGMLLENCAQYCAREIMDYKMSVLRAKHPWVHQVMQVYDELVTVVPEKRAAEAAVIMSELMNSPVPFWSDLPIAAETGVHTSYGQVDKVSHNKIMEMYA